MHTTLARRIARLVTTALVAASVTFSTAAAWADGPKKGAETATALAQSSAPAPKAKPVTKAKPKARTRAKPKAHARASSKVASKHTHARPSKHAPKRVER